ncbi:MAG: hypothetical protein AVDCRST_MAG93-3727, partial [uncultured Chloroflexia bacterium]
MRRFHHGHTVRHPGGAGAWLREFFNRLERFLFSTQAWSPGRHTVKAATRESISLTSSTGLPVVTRLGYTTVISPATAKPSLDRLGHAVHCQPYQHRNEGATEP